MVTESPIIVPLYGEKMRNRYARRVYLLRYDFYNIGVSDETPDMVKVKKAVKIANIDDFINGLPLR